jgi:hypothetical protein
VRRAPLITAVLLVTAVACGSGDDPVAAPAVTEPTSTTTTTTTTTTTVAPRPPAVLDAPGAQPRQAMVLKLAAGSVTRVAMVNKIGLQLTIDGTKLPTGVVPATRTVMEQRVDRVDADGTAHYSVSFTDVSVVPTTGADPAVVAQTQAGLNSLKGVRGTGVVDTHGDVKQTSFDTASVTDPALKSTLDSLTSEIGNLSAPFPSEPVGVGAKWTVVRTATIAGFKMTTTTHYTLRSRAGDRYELDHTQEAVALKGPVSIPNLPAGTEASVTSFSVQSRGQISGDVTRQLPTKSSVNGSGDGTFTVTAGAERRSLVQHVTLDNSISPA